MQQERLSLLGGATSSSFVKVSEAGPCGQCFFVCHKKNGPENQFLEVSKV